MLLNPFHLYQPQSLNEALASLKKHPGARILAGGTFLINQLKQLKKKGLKTPDHIISLNAIETLKGIAFDKKSLIIKSMTTIANLADSGACSSLRKVCQDLATTPIRNMATVGGNLTCRYTWSELPALMIAHDALFHFVDREGAEESIAAEEFYRSGAKTDKILSHVSLPFDNVLFSYQRVKKTLHLDVPILTVTIKLSRKDNNFSDARVVVNPGNHFPLRDKILESFLNNKPANMDGLIAKALNHYDKDILTKTKDEYKIHMHGICIKHALTEILEQING